MKKIKLQQTRAARVRGKLRRALNMLGISKNWAILFKMQVILNLNKLARSKTKIRLNRKRTKYENKTWEALCGARHG
jgi:hypothetical protein